MRIAPLPGPYGLYSVSVMPRFLADSARVGWRGAYFTEIVGAPTGTADHAHERYCLQRVMQAEQHRRLGSRTWQSSAGGFSVWQRGDEQRYEWRLGGLAQFLFIAPEQVASVLGYEAPLACPGQESPAPSPVMAPILDALRADLAQGSPAGPMVGEALLAALIAHLAAAGPATLRLPPTRALRRALELIDTRFAENLSLHELAEAAGLGVRQLTRAFRQATGNSPHQLLLKRRVQHAQALIRRGLPLAEVALQCGFADQAQLTRTFRRMVGVTPGGFRAR